MIVYMYVILYLAVGIVLLNAMLMAVYERIREFGVLKAIGMGPGKVFRLILTESTLQMAVSIAAGIGIAYPWLVYLNTNGIDVAGLAGVDIMGIAMDPVWKAEINAETFRAPLGTFLAVLYVATIIPAIKAGRLKPVDAIRHQ
jgi:ABC-type antimicrobial peptide transport system permease subunit